jgi:hypothetical protein
MPESVSLHVEDVVEATQFDVDSVAGMVPALHSVREMKWVQELADNQRQRRVGGWGGGTIVCVCVILAFDCAFMHV